MDRHEFLVTEQGLKDLKKELEELKTTKRPQAKERISYARNFCDFYEDSEYELAIDELSEIDKRMAELQYITQHAKILNRKDSSRAEIGNTVTFQESDTHEKETYMLVGKEEANPAQGKLFYNSPVGQSLLGAALNDKVAIKTPDGDREVEITDIL